MSDATTPVADALLAFASSIARLGGEVPSVTLDDATFERLVKEAVPASEELRKRLGVDQVVREKTEPRIVLYAPWGYLAVRAQRRWW